MGPLAPHPQSCRQMSLVLSSWDPMQRDGEGGDGGEGGEEGGPGVQTSFVVACSEILAGGLGHKEIRKNEITKCLDNK